MKKYFFLILSIVVISFVYFFYISKIYLPQKAYGHIVSIKEVNSQKSAFGVDIDQDGKVDLIAHTSNWHGHFIIEEMNKISDGESDGTFTTLNPMTTVPVDVMRCVISNGTFWERIIPQYVIIKFEDGVKM